MRPTILVPRLIHKAIGLLSHKGLMKSKAVVGSSADGNERCWLVNLAGNLEVIESLDFGGW